ncbi:hypothetical protein GCM10009662_53280 [Catellatospora coxensis]|uniref:Uncharacterized protein n=1 Tax=Catellatospora coxensis TaxID=310354 RepID=A0A8J3P7J0_9ACTN|nr:hypothetical protein Cco03nite_32290 [Catellatospora coxensis]
MAGNRTDPAKSPASVGTSSNCQDEFRNPYIRWSLASLTKAMCGLASPSMASETRYSRPGPTAPPRKLHPVFAVWITPEQRGELALVEQDDLSPARSFGCL